MKRLTLFTLVLPLLLAFNGPEKLAWHSLPEGLDLARKENRPALIFVYATWCDMSKRMEKKVFNEKEIASLLAGNFVLIKLDVEKDTVFLHSDKVLSRKVYLEEVSPGKFALGVPTTVLYREKEEDRIVIRGVQDPADFKKNIDQFLAK